jgi:hypothetical protein
MRAFKIAAGPGSIAQPGRRAFCLALLAWSLILLRTAPASAELRIADFSLGLNDHELTVYAILLGAIPPGLREGLDSGIPVQVRFEVQLWQYNRFWVDRRILSRVLERQVAYDVLTQTYKVVSVGEEKREPYVAKDLREALRVASELRGLKLTAAATLSPHEIYYVRVRADVAASGGGSPLGRLLPFTGNGEEQTRWVSSALLAVSRAQ